MKNLLTILILGLIIAGCAGKTPEDKLKEAADYAEKQNFVEAAKIYEELLGEEIDDTLAVEVLYRLATIYQNKLIGSLSGEESLEKAAQLFRSIYEKYPKNEKAPMSLFLAGFIQANDLKHFKEATETYQLFLEKFPHHELAISASEELDNMGLTPDEILKKKVGADL
jgi:TolA-binding protein